MASTYPLEIVQAARWAKANPNVKGDAAVKAVENQTWDVSVKSLVAFPQILEPMNEKLDWTQKLGDAFLADQKSVLDAVQRLRAKAEQSGNLKSTEQQKVIVEQAAPQQTVIKIEPANPQTIYVPAYNPTVVYGAWGYPAYPPYYWPPSPVWYPGGGAHDRLCLGRGHRGRGCDLRRLQLGARRRQHQREPRHQHRPQLQSHERGRRRPVAARREPSQGRRVSR